MVHTARTVCTRRHKEVREERGSSAITQQVTRAKHVLLAAHVEDELGMTQVLLAWQTRALCGRTRSTGLRLFALETFGAKSFNGSTTSLFAR